jgi:hypothetical protein
MTTEKQEHAGLEGRHAKGLKASSELTVQLQHPLQGGQILMTVLHCSLYRHG